MFDKRRLQRMQAPFRPCARPSIVVISRPSYCTASDEARKNAFAIHQHRARAARALIAAFFRAGQTQVSRNASSSETRGSICSVGPPH